jgi:hypothetical protein
MPLIVSAIGSVEQCPGPACWPRPPRAPVPSSPLLHLGARTISATTARAPAPSLRCAARSAAVSAPVTASWSLHALARGVRICAMPEPVLALARPRPLHHQGAQRDDLLVGTVARACPLPGARAHDSIGESGHTADAPMPRRLARKRLQGRKRRSPCARIGRHGMVAASGKAATTAHALSATIVHKATCARLGAGIVLLSRPGPSARLGRRPPAASFPPGPPILGTPLAPSLRSVAGIRNPQGGRTLWLRGRSERRGRRRPLRLGGTARDHGPRSRPFPCQPLPPPRGPSACRSTGPAGVAQALCLGRGRALLGHRGRGASWRRSRSRLRSPPRRSCRRQRQHARPAAQRLQRGSLRRLWNSARRHGGKLWAATKSDARLRRPTPAHPAAPPETYRPTADLELAVR